LNVSKVPARVVMVSFAVTFEVPEVFRLTPEVVLESVDLKDHVFPTARGARMPVPSLGVERQVPLFMRSHERSYVW
jgi:hypothetical protein